MRARAYPIVASFLCVIAASGCAYGEVRQVIRAQFASELHCGEVQLKRRDSWYAYEGPDQYKVIGCGEVRTYTCSEHTGLVSYDKPACTWVKGDADAPSATRASAAGAEPGADEEPPAAGPEPDLAAEPAKAPAPAAPAAPPAKPALKAPAPAAPAPAPAPVSAPAHK